MQQSGEGRLLPFEATLNKIAQMQNTSAQRQGQAILMEPRSVRHQERVEDLFYLLFKRTSA